MIYCIPTHCPFCKEKLRFKEDEERAGYDTWSYLFCGSCHIFDPHGGWVCFQLTFINKELDRISIMSEKSGLGMEIFYSWGIRTRFSGIVHDSVSLSEETIVEVPHLIPVNLESEEDIEQKLELFVDYL